MKNTMVSVIMPTYCAGNYITEAVISVLGQIYDNFEILIIDDCSPESYWTFVDDLAMLDERIFIYRLKENSGAAIARNYGISKARGRFIAFLDDDDIWYSHKLSVQVELLLSGAPFVFSGYDLLLENGVKFGHRSVPDWVDYKSSLVHNVIGTLTAVYDTEYFGKVLMPPIRKRQDLGLWLALLRSCERAYSVQDTLGGYRVRDNSISANKIDASRYTWKLYREVEEMPLMRALYYFLQYAGLGLLRSLRERRMAKGIVPKEEDVAKRD